MDKIWSILKSIYSIDYSVVDEVHGGLSAKNYKVEAKNEAYFLKVYDKRKTQTSTWTEHIDFYMPILEWLNENTQLVNKISCPLKTNLGDYRYEDNENIYLLFSYVKGSTIENKLFTRAQVIGAAEIIALLHESSDGIPMRLDRIKEDYSIPFCISLDSFLMKDFTSAQTDVQAVVAACYDKLIALNNEVKLLSERVRQKKVDMVLCHTDAHGWNFIQSECLVLVDWEGIKLAPAEADLFMFTREEYWDVFFKRYLECRSGFSLDNDLFAFYILRRKIEDIWAFIESILYDNLSIENRMRDLALLSDCCDKIDDFCFEL